VLDADSTSVFVYAVFRFGAIAPEEETAQWLTTPKGKKIAALIQKERRRREILDKRKEAQSEKQRSD